MARASHRWLAVAASVAIAVGCSGSETVDETARNDGLRVAAFDFAESELLVELYAQAIESSGVPVRRMGRVGPREIVAPALAQDQIDFVPEYLGTALRYAGSTTPDPVTESARDELATRLAPRDLAVLAASPAQDRNAVIVTLSMARDHELERISDLADLAPDFTFGGPAECLERPLCLVGLDEVYGLRFAEFVPQRSLAFTAESLRRGEIDVGLMFSTAAELRNTRLVELDDDRQLQPAENIVPVVRNEALDRWPGLASTVDDVSLSLTTGDLRALNGQVADGTPLADVARSWLDRLDLSSDGGS